MSISFARLCLPTSNGILFSSPSIAFRDDLSTLLLRTFGRDLLARALDARAVFEFSRVPARIPFERFSPFLPRKGRHSVTPRRSGHRSANLSAIC